MSRLLLLCFLVAACDGQLVPVVDTTADKSPNKLDEFFGGLNLRAVKAPVPNWCHNFTAICLLEGQDRFAESFPALEHRMKTCGTTGWRKFGSLGSGHAASVALRTTPCGMHVAMKATRRLGGSAHISFDCNILKQVSAENNHPACNGCFPQYFYLSGFSNVCYTEFVPGVDLHTFLAHMFANGTETGLHWTKRMFVQGLGALSVLQRLGVRHQDLTFRNLLVRVPHFQDDNNHDNFRLVLLDFGGSYSPVYGQSPHVNRLQLGNRGYSDIRAYACAFYKHFFGDCTIDTAKADLASASVRPGSLRAYLAAVLVTFDNSTTRADFPQLAAALHNVSSLQ